MSRIIPMIGALAVAGLALTSLAAADEPAKAPVILTAEEESQIRGELADWKNDNATETNAVLRPILTQRGEELARGYLESRSGKLDATARLRILRIVREVLPATPATPPAPPAATPSTPSPTPPPKVTADDDHHHSHHRCECVYCHATHRTGTCSNSCPTTALPTLPTVGSYAAAPYYMVPYAPKHHFLHGLLCPCTWCRGGW